MQIDLAEAQLRWRAHLELLAGDELPEALHQSAAHAVGVVSVHDQRQGVHRLPVQLHRVSGMTASMLVQERRECLFSRPASTATSL